MRFLTKYKILLFFICSIPYKIVFLLYRLFYTPISINLCFPLYFYLNTDVIFNEYRAYFLMFYFHFFNQCYPQFFIPAVNQPGFIRQCFKKSSSVFCVTATVSRDLISCFISIAAPSLSSSSSASLFSR